MGSARGKLGTGIPRKDAMPRLGRLCSWAIRTLWSLITAALAGASCLARRRERRGRGGAGQPGEVSPAAREGRIVARPGRPTGPAPVGLQRLGLSSPCDGLLYVPLGYRPDRPAPFLLMLHGSGGLGLYALWPIILFADAAGLIVLAPDARASTWDRVLGSFGPDVQYINQALEHVFGHYAIDSRRLAIGGFSDGASYALSLGLTNGDLFTEIIAFSPGFMAPAREIGKPPIFVSHGTEDRILPVASSQRIVARLRAQGYDVTYREFVGPHIVPINIARAAVAWLTRGGTAE